MLDAFSWEQDGPALREWRAADHLFLLTDWAKISDDAPLPPKKGDYVWNPVLGLVRVETCGAKRASCVSLKNYKTSCSPQALQAGIKIPEDKVPVIQAFLTGFGLGQWSTGQAYYQFNCASIFQILLGFRQVLG